MPHHQIPLPAQATSVKHHVRHPRQIRRHAHQLQQSAKGATPEVPKPAERTAQRCRSVLGRLYSRPSMRVQMAPTSVPVQSASQVQYREKKNTNIKHTARQPVTAGTARATQHCDHHRVTCVLSAGRTVGEVRLQPRLRQRLLRLSKKGDGPATKRKVKCTLILCFARPPTHSIWKARCATRVVLSRGPQKRIQPEADGGNP